MVDAAYHMAGATAVFSANKFERRFRDMHAIAQQIQARDTHYEDVGKTILTARAISRGPTARRHDFSSIVIPFRLFVCSMISEQMLRVRRGKTGSHFSGSCSGAGGAAD